MKLEDLIEEVRGLDSTAFERLMRAMSAQCRETAEHMEGDGNDSGAWRKAAKQLALAANELRDWNYPTED